MRRLILFLLTAAAAAAGARANPGTVGFGLGVTLFEPPEAGDRITALYSARAQYWLTRHVVPSLEVGYARYGADDVTYNYLPVFLRLTYHFGSSLVFDPYAGAGLIYARKWWSGGREGTSNTGGYSALGGLNFTPSDKFGIGAGIEYAVPEATNFDSGYPSFIISLGAGGFQVAFIRWKGPYAYLVHNERVEGPDGVSRVRQRVLFYLGREPVVGDDVVAAVTERFPELDIDWAGLRGDAAPRLDGAVREEKSSADVDEWHDWG